jgi:hypothetical protein
MGRRKGSLNKKTLERMGLDKYKITRKNGGENPQNDRKNSGSDKPKRVRRTKAELIAAGYYKDKTTKIETLKVTTEKPKRHRRTKAKMEQARKQADIPKGKNKDVDRTHLFISSSMSVNQMSEKAIEKARERGDENWEQDFRNDYEKGQKIYYVEINELCHTKELLELYVGTVYSKVMIAWVDRGEAHTIGIEDADKIFREEKEAKKYYSKVRVKNG